MCVKGNKYVETGSSTPTSWPEPHRLGRRSSDSCWSLGAGQAREGLGLALSRDAWEGGRKETKEAKEDDTVGQSVLMGLEQPLEQVHARGSDGNTSAASA